MIRFSPSNPFPHLQPGTFSERDARIHAALVDDWIGLQTESIESHLAAKGCRLRAPEASGDKQELWFGLDVQMLLTPYVEIRDLLEMVAPSPGDTVVDLGAAYGRMGFVMSRHFSQSHFLGFEFVGERVQEGRRCLRSFAPNARLEHADLSSPRFELPRAQIYFIYDYGTLKAIEKTLHDLRRRSEEEAITIVVRGRHTRYLIETRHPWLVPTPNPRGEARATVYRSGAGAESNLRCKTA